MLSPIMRCPLISIIMLMTIQLSFAQVGEEILEILEGNNYLSENEFIALIEEMEDSLFELDSGRDSMKFNQSYRHSVRSSLISTWWRNFEKAQGYHETLEEGGFMGPGYGLRTRLQARGRNFKIKAIAESDPGEADFRKPDHRSAGIEVKPGGGSLKLIFGDYQLTAGLGLGMGTRPVFRSWRSEPHHQIKRGLGFSLHGGSDENSYLRGAAISCESDKFNGKIFISSRDIDATVKENEEWSIGKQHSYMSGVYSTGLHRTQTEINKKDLVYEEISGAGLEYKDKRIELGSLFTRFSYSENLRLARAFGLSERFTDYRKEVYRYSLYGRGLMGPGMLAGEIAFSSPRAHALEVVWSGFNRGGFAYSIIYEHCSVGFFSHNSLVSSSLVKTGGYSRARLNMLYHAWAKWKIQGEISLSDVVDPVTDSKGSKIYFISGFSYDLKAIAGECVLQAKPGKYIATIKIKEGEGDKPFYWQAATGISSSGFKSMFTCPGTFLSARARYRDSSNKITLQAGISLFTGNDGSVPFYTYEPDVYYGMSLPALSGTGSRVFMLLNYNFLKSFSLQVKLSRVDYDDREEIGSGPDQIPFSHRTSLKVQMVYRSSYND